MEHTEFPHSETLAAFIDGQLDDARRKDVVAHIADCDDCYATVVAAREWKSNEKTQAAVTHSRFGRRRQVAALAAAAVIALVFLLTPEVRDRIAMHELVAAANARPQRPAGELPLSGFAFRPAESLKRGVGDSGLSPDDRLLSAAADVAERAESRPTQRNLHAEGVAFLLTGHAADAVHALSRALGDAEKPPINSSTDVALLTDFGAAAYASHDLPQALAAYRRAVSLAPKDAAVRFGLAVTLQAMDRREDAQAAWRTYLALDSTSPWADEARENLKRLLE